MNGFIAVFSANEEGTFYVAEVVHVAGSHEAFVRHTVNDKKSFVHRLNFAENPLCLVSWTNIVLIACHYGNRHLFDVLYRDVCSDTLLDVARVSWSKLLESALHTVLEQMEKSFARKKLGAPVNILLAPSHTYVCADHVADFVPVLPSKHLQAQHLTHHHNLFKESHPRFGLLHIHLGTGSQKDNCTYIRQQSFFLFSQTV